MNSAIAVYHNDTPYYIPLSTTLGGDSTPSTPATQKLPRNLTVTPSTLTNTEIDTDTSGGTQVTASFDGGENEVPALIINDNGADGTLFATYYFYYEGSQKIHEILLIKIPPSPTFAASVAGYTITVFLPETDIYQSATSVITITE